MKNISFLALLVFSIAACSHSPVGAIPSSQVHNQIIQGGQSSPWETFSIAQSQVNFDGMTVGRDGQIWMDSLGSVFRFDISTGQVTNTFTGIDTNTGSIATGPDGNLWMCGTDDVTKLTPSGQVTIYATPDVCTAIVVGPDGAMWYAGNLAVGRITPDGTLTRIDAPTHENIPDVVVGADGNIWAAEFGNPRAGGYHALAKIDIHTFAITEFKKTLHFDDGFAQVFADKAGNMYAVSGANVIYRLSPAGTWTKFALGFGHPLKPGDKSGLYFAGASGGVKWTFAGHKTVTYGLPPDTSGFPAYTAMTGPDHNVWFWNGPTLSIFINRVLSVSPASATVGVGGMQSFTISESGCLQCVWSAVSSNTSIATVSPVTDGQFTVTGVAPGSATVTVSDKAQNDFDVQITVQ